VGFAINEYIEQKRLGAPFTGIGNAPRTLDTQRLALQKAERLLGKPLAKVTKDDVMVLLRELDARNTSDSARNQLVSALRSFFDWGVATDRYAGGNPWRAVKIRAAQVTLPRILSREQIQAFFEAVDDLGNEKLARLQAHDDEKWHQMAQKYPWARGEFDEKYPLFFRVMYYGGLRVNEVCALKKTDIREDGIMVEHGKGGKSRFVPLRADVLKWLREYVTRHPETDYVFFAENARIENRPLGPDVPQRVFDRAARKAGLPEEATPHWLRHAAATHFLERVGRLEVVQEFLGHADINTTRIYAKVLQEDLKKAYAEAF
jgi:site-specific recombinase XerD